MNDIEKSALNGMSWGAEIGNIIGGTIPCAIIGAVVGAVMGDANKEKIASPTATATKAEQKNVQYYQTPTVHWNPK